MAEENQEVHHHHHHRHRKDDSDRFRERQLKASRNKKILSNLLFTVGCILAIIIILAVVWLYTNE